LPWPEYPAYANYLKTSGSTERHFRAKKRALNGMHIGPKESTERHIEPVAAGKKIECL
jgi:hypothetical protein